MGGAIRCTTRKRIAIIQCRAIHSRYTSHSMKGKIVYTATSSRLRLPHHDGAETGSWVGDLIKPQSWGKKTSYICIFLLVVGLVVFSWQAVKPALDSATEDHNVYTQNPPPPPPPTPPPI